MSGFAARLSTSQRAALQALGYRVLERVEPGAAWCSDERRVDAQAHSARAGGGRSSGAPGDAVAYPDAEPQRVADRSGPAPARSRQGAAPAGALPSRVVIDGIGADAPLLRGILAVIHARVGGDDGRVLRTSDALRVDTGGPGPQWRVHADELRASPRRKAALWRALRQLGREPRG